MGTSGIHDQYGDEGISDVEGGLVMLLDDCTSCIDACLRVKPADRLRYFRWDLDDYSIARPATARHPQTRWIATFAYSAESRIIASRCAYDRTGSTPKLSDIADRPSCRGTSLQ